MQKVVAARRLRKSSNLSMQPDFQGEETIVENKREKLNKETESNNILDSKKLQNLSIKICIVTIIVFILVVYKTYFSLATIDNKMVETIKKQYSKNYTLEQVLTFATSIKEMVIKDVQETILKFNLDTPIPVNNQINIYDENKEKYIPTDEGINELKEENKIENKIEEKTEENMLKYEEAVSAVSLMSQDVQDIINQNIIFLPPAKGVITSKFGVREVTDPVVTPYHTGLDIANVIGSNIFSSISGKVINVDENEYYGKFVEVENNGVITKYGHMCEQIAKKGQKVEAGDVIGRMGSTGMATGSHVHFEIKINGRVIDPEIFVKI